MAVKAEFSADTSSFVKEVKKADDALGTFGKNASTLQTQVRAFDSVLAQAGINIGPAAKAIDEVSAAAGKTVAALGAFNVVALAIATALAAWNVGRSIAEFLKLDEAIAHGTATLLGWGDVIAQTSSAQTDTINAAIKNGAAATISYSEAIKFNTEFHKKRLETVKDGVKADEQLAAAMKELNSVGGTLDATLATMSGTVVEAIKFYLDAGVSQSALATAYGVTATQVKAVAQAMTTEAEITKKAAADKLAAEKALQEFRDSAHARQLEIVQQQQEQALQQAAVVNAAVQAELDAHIKLNEAFGLDAQGRVAMTSAADVYLQKLNELHQAKQEGISQAAQEQLLMNQYTDTLLKEAQAQDVATAALHRAPAAFDATAAATGRATQSAGAFMNQLHMLVDDPKLAAFFGGTPQGAAAATLYGGGQSGITPEMAAAMAAGQFIRTAGVGAVHNTFNVNGTAQDVARTISTEIMRTMKAGGKLGSS